MTEKTDRSASERVDVCIVGAGVAGGLVAYSLARRGHDVVILEAGKRFDFEERLQRMETALRPAHSPLETWDMGGERDTYTTSGEVDYPLNKKRVKGVGGTTLHWGAHTLRLHEGDFETNSRYGLAVDWPIGYEDLRPYYAEAERELGVAGTDDNPFGPPRREGFPMEAFPRSYSDSLFAGACGELGIPVHSVPQARNSETYDGRSQCMGYSTCAPVCPSGAKYSGDVHVKKAEAEGVRVIDRAPVQRLLHDPDGEVVEAAEYATPQGTTYRQEARQFVLAGGGIEIPRLLLLSGSEQHPDGLANSSGVVGQYFMDHPIAVTAAELDRPVNPESIAFKTSQSQAFYEPGDPGPGSILLYFRNEDPGPIVGTALRGGEEGIKEDMGDPLLGDEWGDELLERLGEAKASRRERVGITGNVDMKPAPENRVTLDPSRTDDHGNPVPAVALRVGPYERETMRSSLDVHREILRHMDAEIIKTVGPSRGKLSAHHMGTTRMGEDSDESVVDARLRTHDLENVSIVSSSVFPTSGAVPPTLTIAALSLRLADHLDEVL